jgi:hypothetical protein
MIGVFEELDGEVGLGGGEMFREIVDGLALAEMGVVVDHERENVAAPAMFEGFLHVPAARREVFEGLKKQHVVGPRQLCNQWLHNWKKVWVLAGKLEHQMDVACRKPLNFRKLVVQIEGKAGNDAGAPSFEFLASQNKAADVLVEAEELSVGGLGGAVLGMADASFDLAEKFGIEGEGFSEGLFHWASL